MTPDEFDQNIQEEAWDEGYRAGWSDRTKSFLQARTYEQEIANQTANPYRRDTP